MNLLEVGLFVSVIVLYIAGVSYCAYGCSYHRKKEESHPEYVEV